MAGNSTGYPSIFNLDGEEYMIGSEVGFYLNMVRGALYKKYPSLWRRVATPEERKRIIELVPQNSHAISSCITLLKSAEVMSIIKGMGDRYKRGSFLSILKETSYITNNEEDYQNSEIETIIDVPIIESNFELTPPVIYELDNKRIRSFPLFFSPASDHHSTEEIIPIILDICSNNIVLRDFFTWNISDTDISVEAVAELLCDDLGVPSAVFVPLVISSMNEQIATQKNLLEIFRQNSLDAGEKRVIIKLNILIGDTHLLDQFEWDICDSSNYPEKFAVSLVNELGLSLEFIPRISIDIRCQLNWYRSVYATRNSNYLPPVKFPAIRDPDLVQVWTPSVTNVIRNIS